MWETFFVVIMSDSSTTGSTLTITGQYTLVWCLGRNKAFCTLSGHLAWFLDNISASWKILELISLLNKKFKVKDFKHH